MKGILEAFKPSFRERIKQYPKQFPLSENVERYEYLPMEKANNKSATTTSLLKTKKGKPSKMLKDYLK